MVQSHWALIPWLWPKRMAAVRRSGVKRAVFILLSGPFDGAVHWSLSIVRMRANRFLGGKGVRYR